MPLSLTIPFPLDPNSIMSYLSSLLVTLNTNLSHPYPPDPDDQAPHLPSQTPTDERRTQALLEHATLEAENERLEGENQELFERLRSIEEELRRARGDVVIIGKGTGTKLDSLSHGLHHAADETTKLEGRMSQSIQYTTSNSATPIEVDFTVSSRTAQTSHQATVEHAQQLAQELKDAKDRIQVLEKEKDERSTELEDQQKRYEDRLSEVEREKARKGSAIKSLESDVQRLESEIADATSEKEALSKAISEIQLRETNLVNARKSDSAEIERLKGIITDQQSHSHSDRTTFQKERQTWQERMDTAETRAEAALTSLAKSQQYVNELRTVSESLAAERTLLQKSIEDDRTESASTIKSLQNTNQQVQEDLKTAETKKQDLMELLAEALEREQAAVSRMQALSRDLTAARESEGKLLDAKEPRISIDSTCCQNSIVPKIQPGSRLLGTTRRDCNKLATR